MSGAGPAAESVPFDVPLGLQQAAYHLLIEKDAKAALARVEFEAAFVVYERSERRRLRLDRLRALGHSDLLDAYLARANHASQLGTLLLGGTGPADLQEVMANLNVLTDEIRKVAGFEAFLVYPSFQQLRELNYPDPVAYLVATNEIGFALVLEPGPEGRLIVATLPDLLADRAYAQAIHAWYAYRQSTEEHATAAIDRVANWCWDVCMGPLSEALAGWPRVTLVPVGVTQLLPLHVAWTQADAGRTYVSDRVAISIAPNLRLAAANRSPAAAGGATVAAFAPQSDRPSASAAHLPWSKEEATAATTGAGSRAFLDSDATMEAFLASIGSYGCVHFAGHALASISVPWASRMEFSDGPAPLVTIAAAAATSGRDSELGVLSCCTAELGSAVIPSPGVTIANVLLADRFRRVVASLWRLRDDYGAILMARFHQLRSTGVSNSLDALIQAQHWLRDAPLEEVRSFARSHGINERYVDDTRSDITSWGPFFHAGPSS